MLAVGLVMGKRSAENDMMKNGHKRNVAYIVSMQHGMDAWTFRELSALDDVINFHVFPLRYGKGPYMPKPEWYCHRFNKRRVLLQQLWWLVRQPIRYVPMLIEALRTRSIIDFLLGCEFARAMKKKQVEMIHCVYGDHKFFIGYYCKKLLGIPLSTALYGYDLRNNPNWTMFRRAIHAADALVVNCDFNRQLLVQAVGDDVLNKVSVIRHYADIQPYQLRDKVKILMVGGFSSRKGHDVLFKAINTLGQAAENIEVWVAGYPGAVDVERLAQDCGVADKVVVFGSVADQGLKFLFQHCDIFCLPSKPDANGVSEGLPVALIEAMAYGKPVISTRLSGIPELVEEILVEPDDITGLAEAIEQLATNPELRRNQGKRNQEIAQARYSKQNVFALRDRVFEAMGA
jgi:glycosyltransferase involved in cell wall biosynthesis